MHHNWWGVSKETPTGHSRQAVAKTKDECLGYSTTLSCCQFCWCCSAFVFNLKERLGKNVISPKTNQIYDVCLSVDYLLQHSCANIWSVASFLHPRWCLPRKSVNVNDFCKSHLINTAKQKSHCCVSNWPRGDDRDLRLGGHDFVKFFVCGCGARILFRWIQRPQLVQFKIWKQITPNPGSHHVVHWRCVSQETELRNDETIYSCNFFLELHHMVSDWRKEPPALHENRKVVRSESVASWECKDFGNAFSLFSSFSIFLGVKICTEGRQSKQVNASLDWRKK